MLHHCPWQSSALHCVLISVSAYSNIHTSSGLIVLGLIYPYVITNQELGPSHISDLVLHYQPPSVHNSLKGDDDQERDPIYEEVVISVLSDNHNPSNIPLFISDEILNLWILLGSLFDLNVLFSVNLFFKGGFKKHVNMKSFNCDIMY